MSTLFSRIAAGEIPATFIFRELGWFGILDLYPVVPGHLLVIPEEEQAQLHNLSPATLSNLGPVIKRATHCLYAALGCDAVSVLVRDGAAAGQEIPHVHVHLIPRNNGDEPHNFTGGSYGSDENIVQSAMKEVSDELIAAWQ